MSYLQMPIVRWTRAAMRLLNINLGNARIMLHHLQRAVSQKCLQRKEIATATQVGDRKSVPKPMGMAFGHTRFLAQVREHKAQRRLVHRSSGLGHKEGGILIRAIFALDHVTPERAPRHLAQIDDSPFAAFRTTQSPMFHLNAASLLIDIAHLERTKFRRTQPCVQQKKQHRPITARGHAAHREFLSALGVRKFAELDVLEQRFNLFFREWLNWRIFASGRGNALHRIVEFEFGASPGKERGQGNPRIANAFGCQRLDTPRKASGFVLRAQPNEEFAQVACRDVIDGHIAQVSCPGTEEMLVTEERSGAETLRRFLLEKAQNGFLEF